MQNTTASKLNKTAKEIRISGSEKLYNHNLKTNLVDYEKQYQLWQADNPDIYILKENRLNLVIYFKLVSTSFSLQQYCK